MESAEPLALSSVLLLAQCLGASNMNKNTSSGGHEAALPPRACTRQGQSKNCNLTYGQMPAPLIGVSV